MLIFKNDSRIERYCEDTMMRGNPDAVLVARDLQDVREALRYCSSENIPVTFCGSQTSMTGASVAESGLLISTEKMENFLDLSVVSEKSAMATVQSGIITGELRKTVAEQGWFYPPAPTSQDECRIGANVSTNATGEDSFQYGSTRRYVREIKVLMAEGTEKIFSRAPDEKKPLDWNYGGYLLESANPLDWFIGGEGTLGFIYEVTVDLLAAPLGAFSALAPFLSNESAIRFAVEVVREGILKPRAMELIDSGALEFMKTHPTFPESLKNSPALIYFKQEYHSDSDLEKYLSMWMQKIGCNGSQTPCRGSQTLIATTEKQKEDLRRWRHHIPSKINEEYRHYWKVGGGKVGSDWWVPIPRLEEMMAYVYRTGKDLGVPFMAYAHIGRGHPHVNYLCKTPEEKQRAQALLLDCCRKAVSLGGGVAGEHGIGKLHRDLMPIQWSAADLDRMRQIKREFDPKYLLGKGNIF